MNVSVAVHALKLGKTTLDVKSKQSPDFTH